MTASPAALAVTNGSLGRLRWDVTDLYQPAAKASAELAADGFAGARELTAFRRRVLDAWHAVHVDEVHMDETIADLSTSRTVSARVSLGDLDPSDVQVQLLAGLVGQAGELEDPTVVPMSPVGPDGDRHQRFEATLSFTEAGRAGITVRVVPHHPLLGDPLDLGRVAWAG